MYEFLSLKVKCPMCGESLMDPKNKIDNEPGIGLKIEIGKENGHIWLSSIYGSYNYKSEIELPKDEIAKFSCPHCDQHITSKNECLTCGADMVPFYLDMGGKVSICSRSGCKNHFVEFENLTLALKQLYQEYGLRGKEIMERPVNKAAPKKEVDEKTEILESGTFLNAYCPHCKKALIEDEMLKLKIRNGETGFLMLSPYLNVFTSKSTIFLPEDKTVEDLACYHCENTLIETSKKCESCGSPVAKIAVSARTKLIDFYLCTKKGCKWHGLDRDDLFNIRLEDSMEW